MLHSISATNGSKGKTISSDTEKENNPSLLVVLPASGVSSTKPPELQIQHLAPEKAEYVPEKAKYVQGKAEYVAGKADREPENEAPVTRKAELETNKGELMSDEIDSSSIFWVWPTTAVMEDPWVWV